jgi:hypothetical protein
VVVGWRVYTNALCFVGGPGSSLSRRLVIKKDARLTMRPINQFCNHTMRNQPPNLAHLPSAYPALSNPPRTDNRVRRARSQISATSAYLMKSATGRGALLEIVERKGGWMVGRLTTPATTAPSSSTILVKPRASLCSYFEHCLVSSPFLILVCAAGLSSEAEAYP